MNFNEYKQNVLKQKLKENWTLLLKHVIKNFYFID